MRSIVALWVTFTVVFTAILWWSWASDGHDREKDGPVWAAPIICAILAAGATAGVVAVMVPIVAVWAWALPCRLEGLRPEAPLPRPPGGEGEPARGGERAGHTAPGLSLSPLRGLPPHEAGGTVRLHVKREARWDG